MKNKLKNNKLDISPSKAKSIIVAPIITEKSTLLNQFNQISFKVNEKSNSQEIKMAIEKLFKVKVKKVRTLITSGKVKTFKGKLGKRSNIKKAIVTLAEGNSIDISTGV